MSDIQNKVLGYFTEDDWLEIKEYIKEVLKEDIHNLIEEEYIFDIDYIKDIEQLYLKDMVKEVVIEFLEEENIDLKEIIKDIVAEDLRK